MFDALREPWPWWVAGPLVGLVVPILQIMGRSFGVSSNLRHICAATLPGRADFLRYDWKGTGGWNLMFAAGIVLGGAIAAGLLAAVGPVDISEATRDDLAKLGIHELSGLVPPQLFSFDSILSLRGFIVIVVGGFCVGFGTRYAGGCTSGHAITGLSRLSLPSLVAVLGFFAGGLLTTFFFLPLLLRASP